MGTCLRGGGRGGGWAALGAAGDTSLSVSRAADLAVTFHSAPAPHGVLILGGQAVGCAGRGGQEPLTLENRVLQL